MAALVRAALREERFLEIAGLCEDLELAWAEAELQQQQQHPDAPAGSGGGARDPDPDPDPDPNHDDGDRHPHHPAPPLPFYSVFMFSLLLRGDVNNARFLWKRIPSAIKGEIAAAAAAGGADGGSGNGGGGGSEALQVAAAWEVGKAMWRRDAAAAHKALKSFSWSPDVQGLVSAVVATFRQKTLDLIGQAYSTIALKDLAAALGCAEDEAVEKAEALGWSLDPALGVVSVAIKPAQSADNFEIDQLQKLMNYISEME